MYFLKISILRKYGVLLFTSCLAFPKYLTKSTQYTHTHTHTHNCFIYIIRIKFTGNNKLTNQNSWSNCQVHRDYKICNFNVWNYIVVSSNLACHYNFNIDSQPCLYVKIRTFLLIRLIRLITNFFKLFNKTCYLIQKWSLVL